MSIQEVLTQVALTAGVQPSNDFLSSNNPDHRKLVGYANNIAQELGNDLEFPSLSVQASIPIVVGINKYALPSDFGKPVHGTFYDTNYQDPLIGGTSDIDWAYFVNEEYRISGTYIFKIYGSGSKKLHIEPTPSINSNLTFYYFSCHVAVPQRWENGVNYSSGTKVSVANRVYQASNTGVSGNLEPFHEAGSASDGVIAWAYAPTPHQKFSRKDDECTLGDYVIQLGVEARYAEKNGAEFVPDQKRYADHIRALKSNLAGAAILSRSQHPTRLTKKYNAPVAGI